MTCIGAPSWQLPQHTLLLASRDARETRGAREERMRKSNMVQILDYRKQTPATCYLLNRA